MPFSEPGTFVTILTALLAVVAVSYYVKRIRNLLLAFLAKDTTYGAVLQALHAIPDSEFRRYENFSEPGVGVQLPGGGLVFYGGKPDDSGNREVLLEKVRFEFSDTGISETFRFKDAELDGDPERRLKFNRKLVTTFRISSENEQVILAIRELLFEKTYGSTEEELYRALLLEEVSERIQLAISSRHPFWKKLLTIVEAETEPEAL